MSNPSTSHTAKLSRLAGALLLVGEEEYFLIGNTKEPCDWSAVGFEPPAEGDAATLRVRRLMPLREIPTPATPCLIVQQNAQSLDSIAHTLANRLLILRNASFSERLWRIVTGATDESPTEAANGEDVTWLLTMPDRVWEIVREAALKCL